MIPLHKEKGQSFGNIEEDSLAYRWWRLEKRLSGPKFKVDKK
jgi:hypothetical protein